MKSAWRPQDDRAADTPLPADAADSAWKRVWPAALLGASALSTGALVWSWLRHDPSAWCAGVGLLATASAIIVTGCAWRRRREAAGHVQTETARQENARRFERIVENAEAAYFYVDRDGRYEHVNAAWLRMHGYDRPEEVIGQHHSLTCPSDDLPGREQRFQAVLAGRPVRAGEVRRKGRDGQVGYHTWSANAVVRDGEVVGVEGFLIDTTALRLAREQRRASDKRSAAVLAALQEGVVLIDRQWRVNFVNPAVERQFGPVNNQKCYEYLHGRIEPCSDCAFASVASGESVRHERFSRRSGRHYEVCGAPLRGPNDEVEKIEILHDVTARKEMEWKLRRSLREKENLLREVHHRVKNNLQVLASILSLQAAPLAGESAQSILRECRARVRAIGTLHDKLYGADDLARISFRQYVQSLAADLFQSFGVTEEAVELVVAAEGAPLPMDIAVPCGLIVNELLSNALKHAFDAGSKGRIEVTLRRDETGRGTLTVADNGKGLPEELELAEAEGLGLQLVGALVEQLGGRCEIRRAAGTEFRISFGRVTSDPGGARYGERENPGGRRRADRRQGHSDAPAEDEVCRAGDGRERP